MQRLAAVLVALGVVLGAVGCGEEAGDGSSSVTTPAQTTRKDSGGDTRPGGLTRELAHTYRDAKLICDAAGVRSAARDFHLSGTADAFDVAEAYAHGYDAKHSQPAYEGCLEGFGVGG